MEFVWIFLLEARFQRYVGVVIIGFGDRVLSVPFFRELHACASFHFDRVLDVCTLAINVGYHLWWCIAVLRLRLSVHRASQLTFHPQQPGTQIKLATVDSTRLERD